jgi:Anti-sigma-K factor rskA/Putative zinc-finger
MSDGMTHEAASEALGALALDALDASERASVLAHVAGCAECQRELAALEETASEIALAAPPMPMASAQRDRIRARLVARAAADRGVSIGPLADASPRVRADASPLPADVVPLRPSRRGMGASAWMAMAAGLIAIVGIGGYMRASRERDGLRTSLQAAQAERGVRLAAVDSLRAALEDKDRMIANLTGAQVAVMTLASQNPTSPTGRMFWDQAHDAWTLVAHRVPMPKSGRTYQLWLVTPTAKINAGTFMPKPNGEVMMRATMPLPTDSLAAVAVTEEPMGGSPQPTTAPMMVATAR